MMSRKLLKILLVEDNPDHAELVRWSLTEADLTSFELEHVDCLAAADERLRNKDYDAVLLDLGLPDASGFEALIHIRNQRPEISAVVLTSNNDPSVGVEAAAMGAQDYLYKGDLSARILERVLRHAIFRQEMYLQLHSVNSLLDQKNDELQASNELLNRSNEDLLAANELLDGKNDQLEKVNNLLDQKNNQLLSANELLDKKSVRLAQLYETAQQFVDNVSHEFRTPLTVIKEYVSIMHDNLVGELTAKQREFLEIVEDRADDLAIMVDDMLDVSKLEAGLLSAWRRETRMCDIFGHVRPVLERKAAVRKVRLLFSVDEDLPMVYCDYEKVGRVIINLVTNAIKFCGNGGSVKLMATNSDNPSEIKVVVEDDGPGISAENRQLIFKRFHQASEGIKGSTKGFGLGLGIARELVDLNLGEMNLESELGKGSKFSFSVPVSDPNELATRYLDRIRPLDDRPDSISMVIATVETPIEQVVSNAIDEFLQHTFRTTDFVVRILPHKWIALARCPHCEVDDMLNRIRTVQAEVNRNLPGAKLPEITLWSKGTWPVETETDDIKRQFREELATTIKEPEGPRVLLVDDDQELVQALSIRLQAAGYDVITATDGKSAVELATRYRPSAILMDNYMPKMDGLEAIKHLNEQPETNDIPVIIISASPRDQQEALNQGAYYFLQKPCDTNTIMAALHDVISEPCLSGMC